ncbi:unnamed protein product [marine sediment metagenome]|uniref:Uncharacterized protein n=1 Tax=marine sediment metagenome TaxID=412755 RepID=X1BFV9_9ZZZZ
MRIRKIIFVVIIIIMIIMIWRAIATLNETPHEFMERIWGEEL